MVRAHLGRDALGQFDHGLGHLDQLVQVLEGLGDVGVILSCPCTHLLLDPRDSGSDLSLGRLLFPQQGLSQYLVLS